MIIAETLQFLKERFSDRYDDLIISDVRIGVHLTAVRLSDGSLGVAGTLEDEQLHCLKKNRDYGEFTPTRIRGRKIADLFAYAGRSFITETLKVAVLNAISSGIIAEGHYNVIEDADPIDMVDLDSGKTITLVGAFQSYIQKIAESGSRLFVLEFNDRHLSREHRQHFVPAEAYQTVLPGSDVVIITGSALVNNTIDGLLSAISPGTQVIVTGPSSSLVPDVLFRHRVSMVGATRILDPGKLFEVVGESGAGYHLYRYCAQKICIVNEAGTGNQ
ncbi:MAG TPA: DUF364 domain-containing protein [Bacteroidales bacterium]|nr:DUF364 domain-containing protein [Bacteroidales bacterium]HSA42845.1 DUF364 domain-containing protein [Bacteroidales bacterium]